MSSPPPPPIPYSSGRATEDGGHIDAWTLASAACLIFLLWCLYSAFWQFFSHQAGLYFWIDRGLNVLDIDTGDAAANTLAVFGNELYGPYSASAFTPDFSTLTEIPFAIGFGIFISAALFQWRATSVQRLAAMFPLAAGIWRMVALVAKSIAESSPRATMHNLLSPTTIGTLAVVMLLQSLAVFFSAMWGRRLASWIAGALLPGSLSRTLIGLWSNF